MRSSTRSAVLTVLTLLCIALPRFSQTPPKRAAAKTPQGSVSGRVTIKDKGAPGIVVGLRKNDANNPYELFTKTKTGPDGVYRITNVAPGSYQIGPAAPGFVAVGQIDRKDVVVGEDENVEGINFSLARGGVITGKVTDADDHPVVQQQVEIYRAADPGEPPRSQQPQQLYPQTAVQTDDRGIYRFFGIRAGNYKVAAGRGEQAYGGYSPSSTSYKQVFYPDTDDIAKATVIEVTEGSEAKDIDIKLGQTKQTFSVSGQAINSDTGLPLQNTRFGLQRINNQRTEFVNSSITTNGRGEFVAEGLIPGKYGIVLFANVPIELRPDPVAFEVVDQDLTDVTLRFTRGSTISGIVVLDTRDKAALAQVTQLLLRAFSPRPNGLSNSVSSAIASDGSFRLAGLGSGPVNFSLSGVPGGSPPKGFAITRVERDGLAASRIELKDSEQMTGVKIFVSYGTATLRGVVKIENGELPPNVRVYLRLTKPGETDSYLRSPQVDERGHFLLEGLPAGDYELMAMFVGGAVRPQAPLKQPVTLTQGAITDVTFTIDFNTLSISPPRPQSPE